PICTVLVGASQSVDVRRVVWQKIHLTRDTRGSPESPSRCIRWCIHPHIAGCEPAAKDKFHTWRMARQRVALGNTETPAINQPVDRVPDLIVVGNLGKRKLIARTPLECRRPAWAQW